MDSFACPGKSNMKSLKEEPSILREQRFELKRQKIADVYAGFSRIWL